MPSSALPTSLMPAAEPLDAPVVVQTPRPWRRTAALWLTVLAVYWLALFVGTHLPNPGDIGGRFLENDKLVHGAAFAVLTTLVLIAWRRTGGATTMPTRLAIAGAVLAYAVVDEVTQPLFHRIGDLADWTADMIGVGVAVAVDTWRHRND